MSKDQYKQDSRLKNTTQTEDASSKKDSDKLVEVKKEDTSEDKDNEFVVSEKPADEQMHQSFDDLRENYRDEEAD